MARIKLLIVILILVFIVVLILKYWKTGKKE